MCFCLARVIVIGTRDYLKKGNFIRQLTATRAAYTIYESNKTTFMNVRKINGNRNETHYSLNG